MATKTLTPHDAAVSVCHEDESPHVVALVERAVEYALREDRVRRVVWGPPGVLRGLAAYDPNAYHGVVVRDGRIGLFGEGFRLEVGDAACPIRMLGVRSSGKAAT